MEKMKVEIWSDVVCPFCYIGKRHFEQALEKLEDSDQIEVVWKSFQLDPTTQSRPGVAVIDDLAERKGWTREYAQQAQSQVLNMAKTAGLEYNFDKAVVANTFNAHRVLQLAKTTGLGGPMKEALLKAYFTSGQNIDDWNTLAVLANEIGCDQDKVLALAANTDFEAEVNSDIQEAQSLGVRGVPFFVIDRKYGISGAQPTESIHEALTQALAERGDSVEAMQ